MLESIDLRALQTSYAYLNHINAFLCCQNFCNFLISAGINIQKTTSFVHSAFVYSYVVSTQKCFKVEYQGRYVTVVV